MSLKDQLLLTVDEAFAKAQQVAAQKKKSAAKPLKGGPRSRKRKAPEIESDIEDSSSHVGSDLVLLPEILDCIVVSRPS